MNRRDFIRASLAGAALFSMGEVFAKESSPQQTYAQRTMKIDHRFDGLLDQDGDPIQSRDLNDRYNLLFFGFVQCGPICPVALPNISRTIDKLEQKYHGNVDVRPLFMTTQPLGDEPDLIKALFKGMKLHEDFIGISARSLEQEFSRDPKVRQAAERRIKQHQDILDRFEVLVKAQSRHSHAVHQSHHAPQAYLMRPDGSFMSLIEVMSGPDKALQQIEEQLNKDGINLESKKSKTFLNRFGF